MTLTDVPGAKLAELFPVPTMIPPLTVKIYCEADDPVVLLDVEELLGVEEDIVPPDEELFATEEVGVLETP